MIIFTKETDAISALTDLFAVEKENRQREGYTLDAEGGIIPKNAATGEDMPEAQHTTSWDVLVTNEKGEFTIADIAEDKPEYKAAIEGVHAFTETVSKNMIIVE